MHRGIQSTHCTLNYIGGEDLILVLYVPVACLLKIRSGFTFNGDVVVSETIPFHEVQEAWIAEKAAKGAVASGPRRIMSTKAINEVVCQCENADRAVPPQVLKSKVDKCVQKARDLGKDEIIEELKNRWERATTRMLMMGLLQLSCEHHSHFRDTSFSLMSVAKRDCVRIA